MAAPRPPRVDDRSHVVPRRPDGTRRRPGPHLGPIAITPIRVLLAIGLFGSLAFIAYAVLVVEDSSQIPMVAVGGGVLGLVFASLSVGGAIRMWQAWRDGLQGPTIVFAIAGGIAGFIAIGCFAGALILALVMSTA